MPSIFKRLAKLVGVDPSDVSGHSARRWHRGQIKQHQRGYFFLQATFYFAAKPVARELRCCRGGDHFGKLGSLIIPLSVISAGDRDAGMIPATF